MYERKLEERIHERINSGKAIVVLGPRQTGKTTLLEKVAAHYGEYLLLDCDDMTVRENLERADTEGLRQIIGKYKTIFVDEAQRVKNIGVALKIIVDKIKGVRLLVSGSSSLELSSDLNEPLTGRKWEYWLLPIGWNEFSEREGFLAARQQLERRLVYGMYPEVLNSPGDERMVLKELANSYLYKDLLSMGSVRKPTLLPKLLKALALQLGGEVSFNELSNLLQVSKDTVSHYVNLLEQAFVIYRMEPFNRSLRVEISTNRKIYFYDNGIRNALIPNYNLLSQRQDVGALWENFLMTERKKFLVHQAKEVNGYFWRTRQQQEVDYVEEREGELFGYEFKWSPQAKIKFSKTFTREYSPKLFGVRSDNFEQFVCELDQAGAWELSAP